MHDIPELDKEGLRDFALVTAAIIVVLFGLLLPWVFSVALPRWPWILALILSAWGLAAPRSLRPVYRAWMRFGMLLNRVTTPIIMGLVFYLVLFPTGVLMRTFGKDPMSRAFEDDAASYRVPSSKPPKDHVQRPF